MLYVFKVVPYEMFETKRERHWGAWHCLDCGRMPLEVKDMNSKIDTLTDLVRSLIENGNEDRQTNRENVRKLDEENTVLRHQNEVLTREVNELKRRLNVRKTEQNKSLILGSSIIRNIDEKKLDNTEIRCLRGAKVKDLNKELQQAKSAGKKYTQIILLGGGNDAAQKPEDIDLESVLECYECAINTAKDMSSNIAIAAIPPRLQPAHALGHITALNANLVALAEEMGVSFLDNSEQFFLHNKEVNDGYLFDQVHLNIKGSNKLAQSMGLTSNTSDPLDISSIYATQTKPSTWTNRSLKYVAPGLRLKTGDSTSSHEGARHGHRGTAGTPVTSLPTPKSATRGPQSEAQGRRTEESKRSVTQNDDNDFNSPFWNKARSKVNKIVGLQ